MTAIRARFTGPSDNRRTTVTGPMLKSVAFPTERDQVGLCVGTQGATRSQMVNIKILGASAFLTAPTITLQDFSTQRGIYRRRLSTSRPYVQGRVIHVVTRLPQPAAQKPRLNIGWVPSTQDLARLHPPPMQRPRENRRRSFPGNSPETCRCRAFEL